MTKREDGTLVVALWNLVDPGKSGNAKAFQLIFAGVPSNSRVTVSRVDNDHGNTLAIYRRMGSPRYPTDDQIRELNAKSQLPSPSPERLSGDHLDLNLQPNALVIIEVSR